MSQEQIRPLSHLEVNVLDPEADGFHDPQSAAVQKLRNQLGSAFQQREDGGDLIARHHDGDIHLLVSANGIDRTFHGLAEDALVEENESIHGLILGG